MSQFDKFQFNMQRYNDRASLTAVKFDRCDRL